MMPNPFHVTATQMKKHSLIWHIRTSLCLLRIFLTTMSVAVLGICSNEDWHLLWDHLSCRSQRGLCWRIFDLQITNLISIKKSVSKNCLLLILKKPWDKSVIFMRVCKSLFAMILLHIKWGFFVKLSNFPAVNCSIFGLVQLFGGCTILSASSSAHQED